MVENSNSNPQIKISKEDGQLQFLVGVHESTVQIFENASGSITAQISTEQDQKYSQLTKLSGNAQDHQVEPSWYSQSLDEENILISIPAPTEIENTLTSAFLESYKQDPTLNVGHFWDYTPEVEKQIRTLRR